MASMHEVLLLFASSLILILVSLQSYYQAEGLILGKQMITHLHFYLHDTLSRNNQSAFMVAHANSISKEGDPVPFGTMFVVNDPLTEGPELTSKVMGNAQGMYVSSGQDQLSLVVGIDYGFTSGEYNGSSISVFSRNPINETHRELAVVGGRGRFRFARGFAETRTHFFNLTSGDAIVEYNVTVLHYEMC